MDPGSTTFINSSYSDNHNSNPSASTSSQLLNGSGDKAEREDRSCKPEGSSSLRGINTPYKEKFLALRQKYDSVNSAHEDYLRDLELARARMKKLQAENEFVPPPSLHPCTQRELTMEPKASS
ncbi:hypothetical protein PILCRDRAFT_176740 [Piloderma croceum F 1598]|uniref:Uncharacterized protein n=1 Tax=Piloderma croceum (strain F 1598) TaxID=765440 RepID=A0A0C3CKQ1_PILCF|nr:hypothetical protein PILCRDRAFT_176740 [Piloderma croceum F 1598]